VQGRAAIAANFLLRALHAQPVPSRRTSRTQTLHRPTRQILHRPLRFVSGPRAAANSIAPVAAREFRKRCRDCERGSLVCQGNSIQLVVVQFQSGSGSMWRRSLVADVAAGITRKGRRPTRRTPLAYRSYSPWGKSTEPSGIRNFSLRACFLPFALGNQI
jgi:hypothetical protein